MPGIGVVVVDCDIESAACISIVKVEYRGHCLGHRWLQMPVLSIH